MLRAKVLGELYPVLDATGYQRLYHTDVMFTDIRKHNLGIAVPFVVVLYPPASAVSPLWSWLHQRQPLGLHLTRGICKRTVGPIAVSIDIATLIYSVKSR